MALRIRHPRIAHLAGGRFIGLGLGWGDAIDHDGVPRSFRPLDQFGAAALGLGEDASGDGLPDGVAAGYGGGRAFLRHAVGVDVAGHGSRPDVGRNGIQPAAGDGVLKLLDPIAHLRLHLFGDGLRL